MNKYKEIMACLIHLKTAIGLNEIMLLIQQRERVSVGFWLRLGGYFLFNVQLKYSQQNEIV